jgi:hypothetical protein
MMKPKEAPQRSDALLPADDQVAEEVSLDQQSEQARRVGHPAVVPGAEKAGEADQDAGKT